ncbi:hypothetical protein ThrDRAFT_01715 [Frankia casuarinae]|jgi:hypothetical protein|uniref:hypothetical protein n=1 Tax=Frankia TaxID=1854 RepID=UPI0003D00A47|nr:MULTISPECIES: hypothetical protein [Frankia]ETA01956.1 hypothetical protein CcI6DRAFT_02642 [Frankia sp. CcI6]EYT92597.1 hypothetical protein ThrDRAFT_01715 [Frankia casuarinae]OAA24646.1 hypothetical protein AAY23_104562 [Frankia casuarinae]
MVKGDKIRVRGKPRKDIDVELFIQALLLACRDIEEQEGDEVRTPPPPATGQSADGPAI